MKTYLLLLAAIVAEVIATSSLKASESFTRPISSLLVVAGYGTAFFLLSITLKTLPLGVAYASGRGSARLWSPWSGGWSKSSNSTYPPSWASR